MLIPTHVFIATVALCLGLFMLAKPKGTKQHRYMGRLWVQLMTFVLISSFWIRSLGSGDYSPLHLLSIYSGLCVIYAVYAIRKGNITGHKRGMQNAVYALVFTALMSTLPGHWVKNSIALIMPVDKDKLNIPLQTTYQQRNSIWQHAVSLYTFTSEPRMTTERLDEVK